MNTTLYNTIVNPPFLWQMELHERFLLHSIASLLPNSGAQTAVEIGSYYGGCLNYLNLKFDTTYSIDLTHDFLDQSCSLFDATVWKTGPSHHILPSVIDDLNKSVQPCTFFLVDADHEYQAVLFDLYAIYRYKPKAPGFILVHDAAYPPSQKAIRDFQDECHWKVYPNFCPSNGIGGFALIEMVP